ncbi:MAG: hypothetical protein ACK559_41160, partial [bacterium]
GLLDGGGVTAGAQLGGLAGGLGRQHDIGLQAELLELLTGLLEGGLCLGARLGGGGEGLLFFGAGLGFELGAELPEGVLGLDDGGLGGLDGNLAQLARVGLGALGLGLGVG